MKRIPFVGAVVGFVAVCLLIVLPLLSSLWFSSGTNRFVLLRFYYLGTIVLAPPLVILGSHWGHRVQRTFSPRRQQVVWTACISPLLAALFFTDWPVRLVSPHLTWPVAGLSAAGVLIEQFGSRKIRFTLYPLTILSVLTVLLVVWAHTFYLWLPPSRIATSIVDFNASFYSVFSAWGGGWPLVDYFAQYGYYSLFLLPLKFLPPTVESVLSVAGVGIAFSLCSLLLLIRLLIHDGTLRLLAFGSCVFGLFFSHSFPYWANLPIRTTFPFAGLFLCLRFFQSRKAVPFWCASLWCSLAPYWNLDTGGPLLLCWFLVLAFDAFLVLPRRMAYLSTVKNLLLLAGIQTALGTALLVAVGWESSPFSEMIRFHQLYFGDGLMSLPIPSVGVWTFVVFCYLAALVYAWDRLVRLGSGNEALELRARAVSWPAFILIGIFADAMAEESSASGFALFPKVLRLGALSTLCFCCFNSYAQLWKFTESPNQQVVAKGQQWKEQQTFVSSLTINGPVLILSDKSAVFYPVVGFGPPFALPGATELLLQKDLLRVKRYLSGENHQPRRVLLDKDWKISSWAPVAEVTRVLAAVPVSRQSPDGRLLYFEF